MKESKLNRDTVQHVYVGYDAQQSRGCNPIIVWNHLSSIAIHTYVHSCSYTHCRTMTNYRGVHTAHSNSYCYISYECNKRVARSCLHIAVRNFFASHCIVLMTNTSSKLQSMHVQQNNSISYLVMQPILSRALRKPRKGTSSTHL